MNKTLTFLKDAFNLLGGDRKTCMENAEKACYDKDPNILKIYQALKEEFSPSYSFNDLPKGELYELGFGNWDDLILIPLWLYPLLPYGETVTCISGETIHIFPGYSEEGKGYIDNDHRGGCLAYGFSKKVLDNLTKP